VDPRIEERSKVNVATWIQFESDPPGNPNRGVVVNVQKGDL